jgi:two-component system response regulator ResD
MGRTILYAEDEFTNRKIVEMVCRRMNINCILAEDGLQALELFRKETPDLVILDQYMPGFNGDIVAEKIRKENSEIPLIAITSDDDAVTRLENSGFNRVLVKPVKNRDYESLLNTYLE